jgi:hypothetical protein
MATIWSLQCNPSQREEAITREARKTELVDMLAVAIHPEMRRPLQE